MVLLLYSLFLGFCFSYLRLSLEQVGVKNKTTEVQAKLANVILVDANRNQVKCSVILRSTTL